MHSYEEFEFFKVAGALKEPVVVGLDFFDLNYRYKEERFVKMS